MEQKGNIFLHYRAIEASNKRLFNYDQVMPNFSLTGKFEPKALTVLSRSFVEMKLPPAPPDMAKLYTEAFLPGTAK
jgi:hypothetical protein